MIIKRIFLSIFIFISFILPAPAAVLNSAIALQNATPQEQIDQLIKTCRELMAQGKFDDIFPKAEAAYALSQQIGDKARQSRAMLQIGVAAFHSGQSDLAIDKFKQAAALAEAAGDHNLQSLSLNSAATLLTTAAAYEEALFFYNQSLALRRQLSDPRGEALILTMMSELYLVTSDFAKGEQLLRNALAIAIAMKANGKEDSQLEAYILLKTAWGEYLQGNHTSALATVQNYLAQETERTSGTFKYEARDQLGAIYLSLGDYEKAATAYADALEVAQALKIAVSQAKAMGFLGWSKFHLGKPDEALNLVSQALTMLRQTGQSVGESILLGYLAEIQRALKQDEAAMASFRQAIAIIDQQRTRAIPTEISKGNVISKNHTVFAGAIDLLVGLNRPSEAFEIAEAYHARAFLDVLAESKIDVRKGLTPAQSRREETIFNRISSLQKELWKAGVAPERDAQLKKELQDAEQELEAFQVEMRHTNPRYANVKYLQPIKIERLNKELLDADTALIEFVVGEKKSFAWVIQQGKIASVVLPPRQEIDELVGQYRVALSDPVSALTVSTAIAKINTRGYELYQKIFAPLESQLIAVRKLIVVADGSLVYLPFETLVRSSPLAAKKNLSGEYLIDRFTISYAPSASALAAIKATTRPTTHHSKGIIAFGDPVYTELIGKASRVPGTPPGKTRQLTERGFELRQLPYTRTEVNAITALFSATERRIYLGAEAQEERVKAEDLSGYRYLHFAAHGLIDENHPARSAIVLSVLSDSKEDGALQMSEVMRLKLNADLVTLSACRTGLGKFLNGEGMIGLTRAFLYAGADSVAVSLWNVNDLATAELMKAFYKNLKQGMTKDAALRQAKLELLKGQKRTWQHPHFWAPFVLIGEGN